MLIEYKVPADDPHMSLMRQGVVLQWMFQLFDLERNKEYNEYPEFEALEIAGNFDGDTVLYRGSYGVCDSLENLLEVYPELEAEGRQFVVNLAVINKDDQSEWGGWRWHKWGAYIGNQTPTREYLYDEPVIEQVFCYKIYEKTL